MSEGDSGRGRDREQGEAFRRVYAGVPAANTDFAIAEKVLAEG